MRPPPFKMVMISVRPGPGPGPPGFPGIFSPRPRLPGPGCHTLFPRPRLPGPGPQTLLPRPRFNYLKTGDFLTGDFEIFSVIHL